MLRTSHQSKETMNTAWSQGAPSAGAGRPQGWRCSNEPARCQSTIACSAAAGLGLEHTNDEQRTGARTEKSGHRRETLSSDENQAAGGWISAPGVRLAQADVGEGLHTPAQNTRSPQPESSAQRTGTRDEQATTKSTKSDPNQKYSLPNFVQIKFTLEQSYSQEIIA
jgi:hypothetical protein